LVFGIGPFWQFARWFSKARGEQDRKEQTMRSLITAAALLVSVTLTMGFSAESYEGPPFPSSKPIYTPPADNENGSNGKGLTVEQEDAIPYRPCTEALGWVNGHLSCRNE
jgi:hypothetical protein